MIEQEDIWRIFKGKCFNTKGVPECTVVTMRNHGLICSVCGGPDD